MFSMIVIARPYADFAALEFPLDDSKLPSDVSPTTAMLSTSALLAFVTTLRNNARASSL
jgi:hypothetical protein